MTATIKTIKAHTKKTLTHADGDLLVMFLYQNNTFRTDIIDEPYKAANGAEYSKYRITQNLYNDEDGDLFVEVSVSDPCFLMPHSIDTAVIQVPTKMAEIVNSIAKGISGDSEPCFQLYVQGPFWQSEDGIAHTLEEIFEKGYSVTHAHQPVLGDDGFIAKNAEIFWTIEHYHTRKYNVLVLEAHVWDDNIGETIRSTVGIIDEDSYALDDQYIRQQLGIRAKVRGADVLRKEMGITRKITEAA